MTDSFLKKENKILVQGATGREGRRAIDFMKSYGTNVVAGVTPGKGGLTVLNVPIFNSIAEAKKEVGEINISSLYVPAFAIKLAVEEAVENGIKLLHILTEAIPYQDLAYITELCRFKNVQLIGPGSLGILIIGEYRIGMVGGLDSLKKYQLGSVSIISRSGGMTNEIAHYLSINNIGLRMVIHLGSEPIMSNSLIEQIKILSNDEKTEVIVVFEEETQTDFSELLKFMENNKIDKKMIINFAGRSHKIIPAGASFGHVDALIKKDANLLFDNIKKLENLGVSFVYSYEDYLKYI